MKFTKSIIRMCRYLHDAWYAHGYEQGWRSYTQIDGGKLVWANPGKHEWHRAFVADPFLFHYKGSNWLFYETVGADWKGKIGCFREENGSWIQQGIVLEQPWHMSYPQVFEEDGHVYMIPEQSASGTVCLYEAKDFPYKWEKCAVLIERPFADATLLRKDGHYYLACYEIPPHECAELWHAPTLFGPWERHPCWNHINQSPRLRRCGGAFLERDGQLYRMAQDCNGGYGKRLFSVPVKTITPTAYEEGLAKVFLDRKMPPYAYKHTYNEIFVDGKRLSVFDIQYKARLPLFKMLGAISTRAIRKIKMMTR